MKWFSIPIVAAVLAALWMLKQPTYAIFIRYGKYGNLRNLYFDVVQDWQFWGFWGLSILFCGILLTYIYRRHHA